MKFKLTSLIFALAICSAIVYGSSSWQFPTGGGGSAAATWGSITGTLSGQSDLQTALDAKVGDTGTESVAGAKTFSDNLTCSAQYLAKNGSDGSPGYGFTNSVDSGMYMLVTTPNSDEQLRFVVNGNLVGAFYRGATYHSFDFTTALTFGTDNTYDIGTYAPTPGAGNVRPRNVYVGTSVRSPILANVPTAVDLTADNQSLTLSATGMVRLTSDNSTATNRTFVLGDGVADGAHLILEWNEDNTTGAGEMADSGNQNLSATWTPNIGDTISLVWNSTTSEWREIGRSDN